MKDADEEATMARPIIPGSQRTPPPADLTPREKKYWLEYMEAMPANWFGRETLPMLRILCRYNAIAESCLNVLSDPVAVENTSASDLKKEMYMCDKACAMVLRLSTQLQLSPRSRSEFQYLSRKKDGTGGNTQANRPWEESRDEVVN
jgi:hypothetical protein